MKAKSHLLAAAIGAAVCLLVICSLGGKQETYELHPQVSIPPYQTDAARAIDAYERLMERYMDLTGNVYSNLAADLRTQHAKLDSIDSKLNDLLARTGRIERKLGIESPQISQPRDVNKPARPAAQP